MDRQNRSIINKLIGKWPKDTVAVYVWLEKQGVYRQLADTYTKSGWIERIGRGAFKRAGERIEWSGGGLRSADTVKYVCLSGRQNRAPTAGKRSLSSREFKANKNRAFWL